MCAESLQLTVTMKMAQNKGWWWVELGVPQTEGYPNFHALLPVPGGRGVQGTPQDCPFSHSQRTPTPKSVLLILRAFTFSFQPCSRGTCGRRRRGGAAGGRRREGCGARRGAAAFCWRVPRWRCPSSSRGLPGAPAGQPGKSQPGSGPPHSAGRAGRVRGAVGCSGAGGWGTTV